MSIAITVTPTIRPFRGYADPALPDGYWTCHAALLTDASGGLVSINIRMSAAAQPNPSTLWSLDQLAIDHSVGGPLDIRMDFGGFDIQPPQGSTGSLVKTVSISLVDMGANAPGSSLPLENLRRPIFLGAARSDVNVDLSFDAENLVGNSFGVFAQGFFWGPGAINAPGGPQRPLTSLYGS